MHNVKIENGLIVGTSGNKYATKNPIGRYLLQNFDAKIVDALKMINPSSCIEIGCGEAHITELILQHTKATIFATDISSQLIEDNKKRIENERVFFDVLQLENYKSDTHYNCLVCCEVLEHLEDPKLGLETIYNINADWYLLSVPREPIFRTLNFLRGAYVKDFGNSPGHLNHWSKSSFINFIRSKFEIVQCYSPLPWTVIVCMQAFR